jgi:hypothetical protein
MPFVTAGVIYGLTHAAPVIKAGFVAAKAGMPAVKAGASFCNFLASCGHGVAAGSTASGQSGVAFLVALGHRYSDWVTSGCPVDAQGVHHCPPIRAWDRPH